MHIAYTNLTLHRPGDDWKKSLKLPPKDTRMKTSVGTRWFFYYLEVSIVNAMKTK